MGEDNVIHIDQDGGGHDDDHFLPEWFVWKRWVRWTFYGIVGYGIIQWPERSAKVLRGAITQGWGMFEEASRILFNFLEGLF